MRQRLVPKEMASAIALCLILTSPAWAQDAGANKPDDQAPAGQKMPTPEQMQKMMQSMMPGEHHKALEPYAGTWNTETKMWMGGPGSTPMVSTGKSEIKWVLGGRFLLEEHKGTMMGQPYEGIGMYGYDNVRNLYTMSWFSNMATNALHAAGSRPPGTNTTTFYGEMDEPMLGVYGRTVKYVSRLVNNDKVVFEVHDLHAGENYKVIELTYTRDKEGEDNKSANEDQKE